MPDDVMLVFHGYGCYLTYMARVLQSADPNHDVSPGKRPAALAYRPQLDGIRAIACFSVLYAHLLSHDVPAQWNAIPWGPIGVRIFFTMSSFLVTAILLQCRDAIQAGTRTRGFVLRQFHLRRIVRIFPLYYAVLLVLYFLDYGIMRASFLYHVFFVMNIWRGLTGIAFLNHLWAVAVEQQFYLAWPFLVLYLPRRRLVPTIILLIASAPCYRLLAWYMETPFATQNTFPMGSLDVLGIGALLAIIQHTPEAYPNIQRIFRRHGAWLGLAGLAMLGAFEYFRQANGMSLLLQGVFLNTLCAPLCAWLVAGGIRGFPGPGGRFLEIRPLCYFGKISYGVYVLHPLVADLLQYTHETAGIPVPANPVLRFLLLIALSTAFASVSWHCFEKPINDLKRHIPY